MGMERDAGKNQKGIGVGDLVRVSKDIPFSVATESNLGIGIVIKDARATSDYSDYEKKFPIFRGQKPNSDEVLVFWFSEGKAVWEWVEILDKVASPPGKENVDETV